MKLNDSIFLTTVMVAVISGPVIAETSNFDTLTLSRGFAPSAAVVQGMTGGSYSLSSIATRDGQNFCLGFGSPAPDHILHLEQDFPALTLLVETRGRNTTLLVQGPDQKTVRCGHGGGPRPTDTKIKDVNWKAGTYRIWVGSSEAGNRHPYKLSVSETE